MISRPSLVWTLALSLAMLGIGIGLGRFVGRSAELETTPLPAAPNPAPPPFVADPEPPFEPTPPPPAVQRQPKPRPKPRAASRTAAEPQPRPLTLAEALQLLHRAERAIYSNNAAWAISLLDALDARAPRTLLYEERSATRILALCADGQVESAERIARQARREAPASIYGGLLERVCDAGELTPNQHSTGP